VRLLFITAVPTIKLFAWGEGNSGGHFVYYCGTYDKAVRVGGGGQWRTCAMRYDNDEPRLLFMTYEACHGGLVCPSRTSEHVLLLFRAVLAVHVGGGG
jgi:hypothetical protein